MDYQKLALKRYPRQADRRDAETRYWKKFKKTAHFKEYAAVSHIQFSPAYPHDFAVCSSARVQIYSTKTHTVKKTLSRFKDVARGASFRQDGRLLVAGDESGLVQVFDLNSRAILRSFEGHKASVNWTKYLPGNTQILSVSDDRSLRIWDMPSETAVYCWEDAHADYIRAAAVSKDNANLLVTGGYDHTVKLWDLRTQNGVVMSLTHGGANQQSGSGPLPSSSSSSSSSSHPVEALLMFPGDSLLLSAGGNQLRVWDILGGSSGRLLHQSANHQKTITSMCFDGDYTRVLTGSLDQHVKIYDVSDYHVTHSVKYPSPILSIGLSPDNTHLVAGMVNGLLSIRQRQSSSIMMTGGDQQQVVQDERLLTGTAAPVASSGATDSPVYLTRHEKEMRLNGGSYRFFMRGQHKMPSSDDYVVRNESKKPKLKAFEKCLKNFQYSLALDTALQTNMPTITIITLLEELNNRGDGLRIALSSRDDVSLEPILNFIMRNISYPRYVEILGKVLDMIIDMYQSVAHSSPIIHAVFKKIRRKTREELEFQKEMQQLMGVMDMIMGYSETTALSAQQQQLQTI